MLSQTHGPAAAIMSTPDIHIQQHQDDRPRVKTAPNISVPFSYKASNDGTDENLLILLHGLGKWS